MALVDYQNNMLSTFGLKHVIFSIIKMIDLKLQSTNMAQVFNYN